MAHQKLTIVLSVCVVFFLCHTVARSQPGAGDDTASPLPDDFVGGLVEPVRKTVLSFSQAGALVQVPEEGQAVEKGDVIARLDNRKLKICLLEARAALESARLSVEKEKHNKAKTQRLLQEKIIASIALTEADFALKLAESQRAVAESRLKLARLALGESVLTAPFGGVVTRVTAGLGEQAVPGTPVAELVDVTAARLCLDLPMALARTLVKGTATPVLADNIRVGTATVKTILPLVDPASGLRRVIWTIRPRGRLLIGRYVTLEPWTAGHE